ncbi:L,D-transpeptidase [Autumnicola psychrophila]|uniref:L,D-transpeptidase n=1 Tax=Autumnicola psychrophila TaxID=3075592 RepID=A0ABU3DSB5_9FLAO|nr:L,D-transpeptidase [Zunongwangia sp. F225]MDT0686604.1 L,D-transpeptidase [Zunongwangia sp. F225]
MKKATSIKINMLFFLALGFGLLLISCTEDTSEKEFSNPPESLESSLDTLPENKQTKEEEPEVKRLQVKYSIDSLTTKADVDSLSSRYSESQRKTIYALNRIEEYRVQPNIPIIIPDTISEDINLYSPFPKELQILDSIPKAVLIAQRIQGFALYENGRLLKWGPVSSGKQTTPTPNGLHYGNYKAKRKVSTVNSDWILPYYFNFMNFEGVGVHQYNLPGFPASHACVRLYMEDSKFIYDWASMWELEDDVIVQNGTPFMVFGEYNYDGPVPWLALSRDMGTNDLNEEELQTLKSYVSEYKKDPRNFREEEAGEEENILAENSSI